MWKCPKCETKNDTNFCMICGAAKTVSEVSSHAEPKAREAVATPTYAPSKPKVKRGGKIAGILLSVLGGIFLLVAFFMSQTAEFRVDYGETRTVTMAIVFLGFILLVIGLILIFVSRKSKSEFIMDTPYIKDDRDFVEPVRGTSTETDIPETPIRPIHSELDISDKPEVSRPAKTETPKDDTATSGGLKINMNKPKEKVEIYESGDSPFSAADDL